MLCTICCKCGRWYGPWYEDPRNCLGQWYFDEAGKQRYNSCDHLRCGGCGKGDFPLPCEGEKKVLKAPGGAPRKKFNRKKKKNKNRNRNRSRNG